MIKTKRLILRPWKEEDLEPFAKLNADPRVMEYFPRTLSSQESDLLARSKSDHITEHGWGLWAVSLIETSEFIGFIGLSEDLELFKKPVVEVGWRLAFDHWGKGYAIEGAKASVDFGFETLKLDEILSWTTETNMRSRAVMEKLGMHHDPKDDFDHPRLSKDHPLKRHVLYRLGKKNVNKHLSCTS